MPLVKTWLPMYSEEKTIPFHASNCKPKAQARINTRLKFDVYWQNGSLVAWITRKVWRRMAFDERRGGNFTGPGTHTVTSDPVEAVRFMYNFCSRSEDRDLIVHMILRAHSWRWDIEQVVLNEDELWPRRKEYDYDE